MTKGKLLVCEGIDACGKTTQLTYIDEYLKNKGYQTVRVREPGGTGVGEKIRDILLNEDMDPATELFLFLSSRMELITKVIKPAIDEGKVVLCDRFIDSTFAYQGHGRGLFHNVLYLEKLITEHVQPDYVLYFDITLEESLRRLKLRPGAADRLDNESLEFKRKVKQGFTERASQRPDRTVIIDAHGPIVDVNFLVRKWLDTMFVPTTKDLIKQRTL